MSKPLRMASLFAVIIAMLSFPGTPNVAAGNQHSMPAITEVKIDNLSFAPATLAVAVGTTVTWTNRDDVPHTVVSAHGVFKSKVLDTGEQFSYTFARRGVFLYVCSIHPKMTGKVVVR